MPDDVFRWVIAIAVVLACIAFVVQAGVVVALYRFAKRTGSKVEPLMDEAKPILATTRKIVEENKPRVAELSTEAVAIAKSVREQVEHVGELIKETSARAKVRIAQIDTQVDETVDHVGQVGDAVKTAVLKPVREVNGILAGVKAAVSTLAKGSRSSVDHATQDEEMFI